MSDAPEEIVWQGRFVTATRRGRWEYVGRARGISAAVIVAVTPDDDLLLVEQHRVPLGRACLELPAGLVGDETGGESIETAAARELEEETGWRPARIERLGEFASSPGMVSETFHLVRAHDLTRVGDGGGEPGEGITVRTVARAAVPAFIAERRAAGQAIDAKLLMFLGGAI